MSAEGKGESAGEAPPASVDAPVESKVEAPADAASEDAAGPAAAPEQEDGAGKGGAAGDELPSPEPPASAVSRESNAKVAAEEQPTPLADTMLREVKAVPLAGSVTIEILILPDRYKVVEVADSGLTIKQLRTLLSKRLSLPFRRLALATRTGEGLGDEPSVGACAMGNDRLQLVGTVAPRSEESKYSMPDTIDVMVDTGIDGRPVMVQVNITREDRKKPFLGGWRDKRTGKEYHNGATQTIRRTRKTPVAKFTRTTQTVDTSSRSAQSKREQGTQMARRDLYIDASKDRIIASQQYFSTKELLELKERKAIAIQSFVRQCFAFRTVSAIHQSRIDAAEAARRAAEAKEEADRAAEAERVRRRMNPRTKKDFDALYSELRNWREHQESQIEQSDMTPPERRSAMQTLLAKEIKLLQTIDKLKIKASSTNKEDRIKARLELMASPKDWLNSQGDFVQVITPYTSRAAELVQLYNGLKLRRVTDEQRVDILLNVKYTVKAFDCDLTREITELTTRERDMISRGRPAKSLVGLRRRLENLFLRFIETPDFNPGSANFQRVPFKNTTATTIKSAASTALYARKRP